VSPGESLYYNYYKFRTANQIYANRFNYQNLFLINENQRNVLHKTIGEITCR